MPGAASDRLNSWKDIAAYLGKGVRTAQRWERQTGLPVRRLGREGGEIVCALKSEIDAWILRGGHAAEPDQPQGASEQLTEAAKPEIPIPLAIEAAPPPARRLLTPPWAWSFLILLGIAGMAMSLTQRKAIGIPTATAPNPVGAAYDAGVLRAWDTENKALWKMPIGGGGETRLDTRIHLDPARDPRRISVEDLDGDGVNEVLLILSSATGSGDSLRVFNADGSVRFTHVAGRPVTFGAEVYRGFNANNIYVFRDAEGVASLWVTSAHVRWFPALLQRISPHGEVLSEYWSNGHISTVRPAILRDRPFLLVGAYNNERHGASLTFLDLGQPTGTAPSEKAQYRCRDCAEGEPGEFLVFPGADVMHETTAFQGSAMVADARLSGGHDLMVTVHQSSTRVPGEADPVVGTVNYTLSMADLTLRGLLPGWGYLSIHKAFERAGRLDHAFGPKEEKELSAILRWSHGRFVPLKDAARDPVFARARETPASRAGS